MFTNLKHSGKMPMNTAKLQSRVLSRKTEPFFQCTMNYELLAAMVEAFHGVMTGFCATAKPAMAANMQVIAICIVFIIVL